MVTRACISINNRCNLNCTYCHFHEKKDYIQEDNMDVITILDIITSHIEDNDIDLFKLGFVGNGEPMLDYEKLKQYIAHIGDYLKSGRIAAYTITNGLLVDCEKLEFFKEYNVNVGFSVDGISAIHDKYRCGTHERVMANIALYKEVNGKYPSMNCTVGKEIIDNPEATIGFFEQFGNRITFSRMIGKQGISLLDFNAFLNKAMERLNVRTGGYDCTMYGGMCGAGMALACEPSLLIADEPTTALDVTIQAQILKLMNELKKEKGTSILFITHDLGVINQMADEVAVMYCGQVVEMCKARTIFAKETTCSHPYTEGLMTSIPRLDTPVGARLEAIPGAVPHPLNLPKGCKFAPRCKYATEKCMNEEPKLELAEDNHLIRCFYPDKEARHAK